MSDSEMDILIALDNLRGKRQFLEQSILARIVDLIVEFNHETGCQVSGVDIRFVDASTFDKEQCLPAEVKVEVKL